MKIPAKKGKYVIESFEFPGWCGINLDLHARRGFKKFSPKAYRSSSFSGTTRLHWYNVWYYYLYLAFTHKWIGKLRIKNEPLKWWETEEKPEKIVLWASVNCFPGFSRSNPNRSKNV